MANKIKSIIQYSTKNTNTVANPTNNTTFIPPTTTNNTNIPNIPKCIYFSDSKLHLNIKILKDKSCTKIHNINDNRISIFINEQAIHNKANKALRLYVSSILNLESENSISIIKGMKLPNKTLRIEDTTDNLLEVYENITQEMDIMNKRI